MICLRRESEDLLCISNVAENGYGDIAPIGGVIVAVFDFQNFAWADFGKNFGKEHGNAKDRTENKTFGACAVLSDGVYLSAHSGVRCGSGTERHAGDRSTDGRTD